MQQLSVPFLLPPPIENSSEIIEIEVKEFKPPTWKCHDCTPEEKYVLEQIQENTKIKDRNALLRLWEISNRKASLFPTYAREGLSEFLQELSCGGYGLIQWTSVNRYNNLVNSVRSMVVTLVV